MAPKRKASDVSNADSVVEAPPSSKKSKASRSRTIDDLSTKKFVTIGRPSWDFNRQYKEGQDIPMDEFRAQADVAFKSLEDRPDWPWIASEKGYYALLWNGFHIQKRNQDQWHIYVDNDYNGYAFLEMVENMLNDLYEQYVKKEQDPYELVMALEVLVHFLTEEGADLFEWLELDDEVRLEDVHTLIGEGFSSVLHVLHLKGLMKPDTPIKSLPTIISSFLAYMSSAPGTEHYGEADQNRVSRSIAAYCDANELDYRVAYKIDPEAGKMKETVPGFYLESDMPDPFMFKTGFESYEKRHGAEHNGKIGGDSMDITKWSKDERIKAAFDDEDPMIHMAPELKKAEDELRAMIAV